MYRICIVVVDLIDAYERLAAVLTRVSAQRDACLLYADTYVITRVDKYDV